MPVYLPYVFPPVVFVVVIFLCLKYFPEKLHLVLPPNFSFLIKCPFTVDDFYSHRTENWSPITRYSLTLLEASSAHSSLSTVLYFYVLFVYCLSCHCCHIVWCGTGIACFAHSCAADPQGSTDSWPVLPSCWENGQVSPRSKVKVATVNRHVWEALGLR